MSGSKRRCATCRYFQDGVMGGAGWCTHPKRQESSDVRILVRPAELACRNAWGVDFWEARDGANETDAPAARDDEVAGQYQIPDISYDDEVTEVVSAEFRKDDGGSDRVVEQRTILPDHEDDSTPLDRFDLLARGGRDAVAEARRRAVRRRGGPTDEEADDAPGDDMVGEHHDRPAFEPDDFVETESPAPQPAVDADDEEPGDSDDRIINEGTSAPGTSRSRRLRRSRGATPDPKGGPVEMTGADRSETVAPSPTDSMVSPGPFDSIPDVSSDMDISRFFRDDRAPSRDEDRFDELPASTPGRAGSNFDDAIKRAQAIKAAARAERETRMRQNRRPITPPVRTASDEQQDAEPSTLQRARISTRDMDTPATTRDAVASDPVADESFAHKMNDGEQLIAQPHGGEARHSWWRGMFAERRHATPVADANEWDDAPSSSHTDEPGESDFDTFDQDIDEGWETLASESLVDAHTDEWTDDPVQEQGWDAGEAALDDVADDDVWFAAEKDDDAVGEYEPAASYSPIDLDDERGLDTFRSRLFASSNTDRLHSPQRTQTSAPATNEPRSQDSREARPPVARERRWADGFRERREKATRPPQRHREPDVDPAALLDHPDDAWYEPQERSGIDLRAVVDRPQDLLDMTIIIAPDVDRQCSTCRNYRQAEHGERGWCTNNYAFTHRQMVNAEDLACQSTIGCWWLPADEEVWLTDEEPAVAATPRVDRLLAHLEPLKRAAGR